MLNGLTMRIKDAILLTLVGFISGNDEIVYTFYTHEETIG